MTSAFPSALPGTRSARRVHVPPPPSGQLPDPGGRDAVERAHRLQQQAADLYSRWRASFPAGIDPDEIKDNAGVFAYSDAALALEPALAAVKADADAASQRVADAVKNTTVPDDKAAQAQRIWARTQRRLDAAKGAAQKTALASDLISGAEGLTLGTLQEELPDYLEGEGVHTSWLPAAFAARVPDAADAVADATRLAKARDVVVHNHKSLTKAFAKGVDAPPLLDPAIATAQAYTGGSKRWQ